MIESIAIICNGLTILIICFSLIVLRKWLIYMIESYNSLSFRITGLEHLASASNIRLHVLERPECHICARKCEGGAIIVGNPHNKIYRCHQCQSNIDLQAQQ
jgi:hypothetical protein